MSQRMSFFALAIAIMGGVVTAGCNGSSRTGPTIPGYNVVPSNIPPITIPSDTNSGRSTISFGNTYPAIGGTAKVGEKVLFYVTFTNDSDQWLAVLTSVSNGPDDNPEKIGRSTADGMVISPGLVIKIAPGVSKSVILGSYIGAPDAVPFIRLMGWYRASEAELDQINFFWSPLGWWTDVHIGWTFVS